MAGGSSGAIFELLGQHVDLVGRAVITALDRLGLVEVWAGLLAFIQLMWVTHPPHSAIHSRTKFLLVFHNLALEGYCHDNYKHQMTLLMARQNTNQGLLSEAFKFSTPGLSECAVLGADFQPQWRRCTVCHSGHPTKCLPPPDFLTGQTTSEPALLTLV